MSERASEGGGRGSAPAGVSLERLQGVPGFVGASICDAETGLVVRRVGDPAVPWSRIWIDQRSALARVARAAEQGGRQVPVDEMLVSLGKSSVLSRRSQRRPSIYVLLLIRGESANPAVARYELTRATAGA